VDFFRDVFLSLILFRSAFVLVDLPKTDDADVPATLADQKASGALDPYLVLYTPRNAINWETDSYGNLLWVIFKTTTERRAFGQDGEVIDRWYYFDQQVYAVYEATHEEHSTPEARSMEEQLAKLVDGPAPHALADAGRVPVQWIQAPDALWLANRIYLHAIAHLNMQNAYFWGLFMACLPVLWVKGEFTTPPAIVETGYLGLTEQGGIGYVEPSGTSYKIASQEIGALREEMYRQVYLQAQGKSSGATASAHSGYSKEQDMAPSRDVLNGIGDILRAGMQRVLGDVATVHGDADQEFDVRGFNFDDTDEAGEVATVQMARDLEIQSDTLDKEIQKRAARVLMKDGNPDVMEKIKQEIDAAPTKTEQAAQQKADQQQRMQQALSGPATTGNPDSPLTKALPRFEGKLATSEL
jgi:hypothetical protein